MLHYDRIDLSEGADVAKSNNSIICLFKHGFLIMGSNFKILYVMVAMILQCYVLI